MTTPACPRSWEVEAARDGRLTGEARNSLELHLEQCETCAREQRIMHSLGERLRATTPAVDIVPAPVRFHLERRTSDRGGGPPIPHLGLINLEAEVVPEEFPVRGNPQVPLT